jgi:hyperosmotically inducible periplasmic protein
MVIGRSSIGFSDLVHSYPHPVRTGQIPDHYAAKSDTCTASGKGTNGSNIGKVREMERRFALAAFVLPAMLAMGSTGWTQSVTPPAPNDSGINVRDRDAGAMTAGQQSNQKSDIQLTRQIRRAVEKDRALSTVAHNVKIVTLNGMVTLRGPVKTEQEKGAIGSKAQMIAGNDKVDNQLEVETH